MNQAQRDEFMATGVLRAPGLVSAAATQAMAERLWSLLAQRDGVRRDRPETWTKERPAQFGELRRSGAFEQMASGGLVALLDAFFGEAGWRAPDHWGQALVTFPTRGEPRSVPGGAWHLDIAPGQMLTPWPSQVRVFVLLSPIETGGGGTAYVAGSHRLVLDLAPELARTGELRSGPMREALKRESRWIAALCSARRSAEEAEMLQQETVVCGATLRIAEMTGEAGDVLLMHPATLHAPAPNRRSTPRMMLVESIYAGASAEPLRGPLT